MIGVRMKGKRIFYVPRDRFKEVVKTAEESYFDNDITIKEAVNKAIEGEKENE